MSAGIGTLDAIWRDVAEATMPADMLRLLKTLQLVTTGNGKLRAEHVVGVLPAQTVPPLGADTVELDDPATFAGAADVKTYLSTITGTFAPISNPVFTGTLVAPTASVTGILTAADLVTTGDATLGNGDSDVQILRGHLRHKSAAPSIAIGLALGSGGSAGVAIIGSDQEMQVTLTAGTTALAAATAATITFATVRPNTNFSQTFAATNSNARTNAVQAGLSGHSMTTITIVFNVAPTANLVYQWDIRVGEFSN